LLILDEPTNHLDIYSIDALTDALQHFKGAVVLITHNCNMLDDCAKELYLLESGVCRVASCAVGIKFGEYLMRSQPCMVAERFGNAVETSHSDIIVRIPAKSREYRNSQLRGVNSQLKEEPVVQSSLPPLSNCLNLVRSSGPLRTTEKEFLKCIKRVREILKLESLRDGCDLDKAQKKKMEKKAEAIEEMISYATYLPVDSDLLARNADVKELLESQRK
jgi:ABC-type multidrug transport system ATPase subunit